MVNSKKVEDELPIPLKFEINGDMEDLIFAFENVRDIIDRHNENYVTKINEIYYQTVDHDDEDSRLEWNEYTVSIGKNVVLRGGWSDIYDEYETNIEFYKSLLDLIEQVLVDYHDKIIEQQNVNEVKLMEFEKDGNDEILYLYYSTMRDRRAFLYLKRLAQRYPNSFYRNRLRRVYVNGSYSISKNSKMANKLKRRRGDKNF